MITESAFFAALYLTLFITLKDVLPVPMKRTKDGYELMDKQTSRKIIGTYLVLVHSIIGPAIMFYCSYIHEEADYRSIYYIEVIAYTHSIGFFMFDLVRHYYYKTLDVFYFWHHAVVIVMYSRMVIYPECAKYL